MNSTIWTIQFKKILILKICAFYTSYPQFSIVLLTPKVLYAMIQQKLSNPGRPFSCIVSGKNKIWMNGLCGPASPTISSLFPADAVISLHTSCYAMYLFKFIFGYECSCVSGLHLYFGASEIRLSKLIRYFLAHLLQCPNLPSTSIPFDLPAESSTCFCYLLLLCKFSVSFMSSNN